MLATPRSAAAFDVLVEQGVDLGHLFETHPIPASVADTSEALLEHLADEHDRGQAQAVGRAVAAGVVDMFAVPAGRPVAKSVFLADVLPACVRDEIRKRHPHLNTDALVAVAVHAAQKHADPRVAT